MTIDNVQRAIEKLNFDTTHYNVSDPVTLDFLNNDKCCSIPTEKGIYLIIRPDNQNFDFDFRYFEEESFKCSPKEKYEERCKDKEILYIGKAEGKNGLRQRIRQYIKTLYEGGKAHRGGRAIGCVKNFGLLFIIYILCENASQLERQLIGKYKERNEEYPLANWRS
ncbi:MAG: hypothetical protein J5950_09595 [Clostridia bacterium]|nr:hypothetical protein [Clostridia bacterium]